MPRRAAPDRQAALAQYRRRAGVYDLELAAFEPLRRQAIEALGLRPGDTVLDVGCGTGLSLSLLLDRVGATGRVVGIEQSPEMIAQARERVQQTGWPNVELLCAPVEEAAIPGPADAVLFHFTHDILRRPEAVAAVIAQLRPGAGVVAAGLKWADHWAAWPTNVLVWSAAAYSVTSLEGLAAPWNLLAERVPDLAVQATMFGGAYIAHGRVAMA